MNYWTKASGYEPSHKLSAHVKWSRQTHSECLFNSLLGIYQRKNQYPTTVMIKRVPARRSSTITRTLDDLAAPLIPRGLADSVEERLEAVLASDQREKNMRKGGKGEGEGKEKSNEEGDDEQGMTEAERVWASLPEKTRRLLEQANRNFSKQAKSQEEEEEEEEEEEKVEVSEEPVNLENHALKRRGSRASRPSSPGKPRSRSTSPTRLAALADSFGLGSPSSSNGSPRRRDEREQSVASSHARARLVTKDRGSFFVGGGQRVPSLLSGHPSLNGATRTSRKFDKLSRGGGT